MRFIKVTILAMAVAMSGAAFAQDDKYEDVTEYEFKDDLVEGDLIAPTGSVVPAGPKRTQRSLIKVRRHFIPQMLKSVEDI